CSVDCRGFGEMPDDFLLAQSLQMVDEAGTKGADIVCLPEFAACERHEGRFVPQPIPGEATDSFARLAKKHNMYVIAPLQETVDDQWCYNTAALLDRSGVVVGTYRKTHVCLPDHCEGENTLPGDDVPVFGIDIGRVAITTCMDIHYPELYAVMALKGAEIIFWPTACFDYTGDLIESLVNARAIDTQSFFVTSHYAELPFLAGKTMGRSRIVDPMGRTRADTSHFPGIAIATVDLDQTYPMWYTGAMLKEYPTMRSVFQKTRRPELYGPLVDRGDMEASAERVDAENRSNDL
ncbi:MAG: carbon-nitrogen hydrolase family protein, partial [Candidatus Latescibacteria bacterium]|nr:carbon-nitrogen hydrolase family protein [Candidatus Latescibacterota bacterium]